MNDKIKELKRQLKEEKKNAFENAKFCEDVVAIWEEDKRVKIPNRAKRLFCQGCRMNYYNGKGADECWSLGKAKLCKKKVYPSLDSVHANEEVRLNCFIKQYH